MDGTSGRIDANYGFTATHISPAILMGSVKGEVMSADSACIAAADRHFALTLSNAEYNAVMAAIERWRALKQPSYNLNRRNCVPFVADLAAATGLTAGPPKALMKKPRSYLESLSRKNQDCWRTWGAYFTATEQRSSSQSIPPLSASDAVSIATPRCFPVLESEYL